MKWSRKWKLLASIAAVGLAASVFAGIARYRTCSGDFDSRSAVAVAIDAVFDKGHGSWCSETWIASSVPEPGIRGALEEMVRRNRSLAMSDFDSLEKYDSSWNKYQILSKPLVNVERIDSSGHRLVVSVGAIRSIDEGRGFEVTLESTPNGYRVVEIKDTWIY